MPYWLQPPAPRGFFEMMGARMGEKLADQPALVDMWLAVAMKNLGELLGMVGGKQAAQSQQTAQSQQVAQLQAQGLTLEQIQSAVIGQFNAQSQALQEQIVVEVQRMVREEMGKLK